MLQVQSTQFLLRLRVPGGLLLLGEHWEGRDTVQQHLLTRGGVKGRCEGRAGGIAVVVVVTACACVCVRARVAVCACACRSATASGGSIRL